MRLVMAGGGTGGHLFPALALAEEFKRRIEGVEIVFIGGVGGLEEKVVPARGYPLRLLKVEGLKRRRGLARVRALVKATGATMKAVKILRELSPDGVIGSGSYSSAPVVMAAKLLGMKSAVLEQNALPGLTNKLLGRFVNRVYIAFEEAGEHFPKSNTVVAGNPIREEILKETGQKTPRRGDRFTILVFGGSQGATAINAAFLDATEYLTDIWPGLRVIHQTGSEGYDLVAAGYRRKGLKAEVYKFIEDMASAYASADLVVCRAGATSIAEMTAVGVPPILVPYPFASDNHQEVNARCMESKGAAVMIRQDNLTGSTLAEAIRGLYEDPSRLKETRERVRALGRPDAAKTIAEDFLSVVNG